MLLLPPMGMPGSDTVTPVDDPVSGASVPPLSVAGGGCVSVRNGGLLLVASVVVGAAAVPSVVLDE